MSNNKTGNKVLYVGNYTIDIAIRDGVRYDPARESFFIMTEKGSEVEVCEDPNKKITTDKNDCTVDLTSLCELFPKAVKLGGGGRNSLEEHVWMVPIERDAMYLDMQKPFDKPNLPANASILQYLKRNKLYSYFLGKRDAAVNVVLGGGQNKRVIKSPIRKNIELEPEEEDRIVGMVGKSRRVVMNSVKDESIAKLIVDYCRQLQRPLGVVVTTSFEDPKFVANDVIPYATCIFNYDEIGTVFNPTHKSIGDENSKRDDAYWGIRDAFQYKRSLNGDARHSIYVTLGCSGVLAAAGNGVIYHISLQNKNIRLQLSKEIPRRQDATNGAGDHFATAVLMYQERGDDTVTAALKAQMNAIWFIGYQNRLLEADFKVEPVNASNLDRILRR